MCGVGGSFKKAACLMPEAACLMQTALLLDILDLRKWSPCDVLDSLHHLLQSLVLSNSATSIPDCHTVC